MTYHPKSEFLDIMIRRGFMADCTDLQGLDEALIAGVVPAYIGYDATATSLHVGHLLNIMMLRWLQKTGHKPITLMGGGTTKVGDPSGRDTERSLMTPAQIDANIRGISAVFSKYLDYGTSEATPKDGTKSQAPIDIRSVLHSRYFKRNKRSNYEDFLSYILDSPSERLARVYVVEKFGWTKSRGLDPKLHYAMNHAIQAANRLKLELRNGRSASHANEAVMLNNAEWLDNLRYLGFLRNVGRHFSINRMLSFESVKSRLDREQSLSFLEFNYMILQAYDFMELNRRYGCLLQMGGSDQWGNIVNGIDLTRRVLNREIYGLTSPLLTTSDGRKMGKSAGGAIWLDAKMLHPTDFWQFWRNTSDADVGRFLKLYTEIPLDECERLGALGGSEINEAKKQLAREVTTLLHGAEAAKYAEAAMQSTFRIDVPDTSYAFNMGLPTLTLSREEVGDGISVVQLIVRAGLAASGKEAKRLIADNGARLDDAPLTDPGLMLDAARLATPVKLSAGRKRHALVTLAG